MHHNRVIQLETGLQVSSPYFFGDGIVDLFPGTLLKHALDRAYLVTSGRLLQLFGHDLVRGLHAAGARCDTIVIDDSERRKDWATLRTVCEALTAGGATKDSIVIAMGGGVIGNVAGLAAALVYRGIRFVHLPTTVTAQTDSTLSNKQAINGGQGKNQFGVYHAPLFIWADAAYSHGEPARQQKSGIVEGIKNVLIAHDRVTAADEMLDLWHSGRFPELLRWLIDSKLRILKRDPTERGYAIVLEYGHTFGHAIEWLSGGELLHGEAVSIGLCLAAELSHAMGLMPGSLLHDHYRLLGDRLGTPTRLPPRFSPESVYAAMLGDNKRTAQGLRFLLLQACGQFANVGGDYMSAADRSLVLQILERSSSQPAPAAVPPGFGK